MRCPVLVDLKRSIAVDTGRSLLLSLLLREDHRKTNLITGLVEALPYQNMQSNFQIFFSTVSHHIFCFYQYCFYWRIFITIYPLSVLVGLFCKRISTIISLCKQIIFFYISSIYTNYRITLKFDARLGSTIKLTLNMLNCFEKYKIYIHILDLAWPK